jgi:hypothetical protein
MNSSEFQDYKTGYRSTIRKVSDESGFRAYSHPNRLINWLFWQQLQTAIKFIEIDAPYERLLDFGPGSDVMLSFLAQHSQQILIFRGKITNAARRRSKGVEAARPV